MNKKQIDIQQGLEKEKIIKPVLEKYFNIALEEQGRFDLFDFSSTNAFFELKSRNNKKLKYPTTMVGYNKVKEGFKLIEQGKEIYFVFNFTDTLSYYKLDNTFSIDWVKLGGRQDRGFNEQNNYVFIPVDKLKDIN
jgi:hypothetical protein